MGGVLEWGLCKWVSGEFMRGVGVREKEKKKEKNVSIGIVAEKQKKRMQRKLG